MADINKDNIKEEKIDETKATDTTKSTESKSKEKRIDLYKLVENYNKRSSTKLKEEFLKAQVKIVPYQGYTTKLFLAQNIINISCMKDGKVHIDSCKKYLLYIYALIDTYTNIEINQKEWVFQYDRLDSLGLIEPILSLVSEKERATFKTILDMKLDDLMTNKYGIYAYIDDQMDRFTTIAPEIAKVFTPLIDKLSKQVETLDENKIEKMLSKLMKVVNK